MERIATITVNPTIDLNTRVEQVTPDRKLSCAPPRRDPGGGGVNVSRAIRRLGGESTLLYLAGGPTGDILAGLLDEEMLTQLRIPIEGWTRENVMVLEESSGKQFRFGMPGPELSGEEGESCLEELSRLDPAPAYVVASGSLAPGLPEDFYAQIASRTREMGSRLVVDTSGAALRHAVEAGVFLLKPNLNELRELLGEELDDEGEQVEAAGRLVEEGCAEVVVLSLGRGGALLVTEAGSEFVRTPTVRIRSKVGAGDSMVAGLVLALARGLDLGRAVHFGVAAGAAAVMTEGTELCRREDTERLFRDMVEES